MTLFAIALLVITAAAPAQQAQGHAGAAAPPAAAEQAPPAQPLPTPPADYEYSPNGRRDPFVALIHRASTDTQPGGKGQRPEGVPGIMVDELVVRGIVQSRGAWVAVIGASNGKTYMIRPGDRLMDGRVRAITPQTVVLMQEVKDPLSLAKQREVRKNLRGETK